MAEGKDYTAPAVVSAHANADGITQPAIAARCSRTRARSVSRMRAAVWRKDFSAPATPAAAAIDSQIYACCKSSGPPWPLAAIKPRFNYALAWPWRAASAYQSQAAA